MKKKLTRSSFTALRETATLLDEREQRAVIGGDYWDDNGYWTTDSSWNMYWTRTSDGGGYYYGDSGYTGDSGSGSGSGIITQDQFFNWSGVWPCGYVEGMGYVPPDIIIYGGSGWLLFLPMKLCMHNYARYQDALKSTNGYTDQAVNKLINSGYSMDFVRVFL